MVKWLSSLFRELEHLAMNRWPPLARGSPCTNSTLTNMEGTKMEIIGRVQSGMAASTSGRRLFSNGGGGSSSLTRTLLASPLSARREFLVGRRFQTSQWKKSDVSLPSTAAASATTISASSELGGHFTNQRAAISTSFPAGVQPQPQPEQQQLEAAPQEDLTATATAATAAAVRGGGYTTLEGSVQKVNFRSQQTAYTVLKLSVRPEFADMVPETSATAPSTSAAKSTYYHRKAVQSKTSTEKPRKPVITVVGTFPAVAAGQTVRITGTWTTHQVYGHQLRALTFEMMTPEGDSDMVAFLSGGTIPGVGEYTAGSMVETWKDSILDILDSPEAVQKLVQCEGIGEKKAIAIKRGWDSGKEIRDATVFLKEVGVPTAVAQRVAETLKRRTRAAVSADPYKELSRFRLPLVTVDRVAAAIGAPVELVSRAAAAVEKCLVAAAEKEGHTFLPWSTLEHDARKLLDDLAQQHGNYWPREAALSLVVQHMHATGAVVIEPDPTSSLSTSTGDASTPPPPPSSSSLSSLESTTTTTAMDESIIAPVTSEIDALVKDRLPSANAQQLDAMFAVHGGNLPAVLDLLPEDAFRELVRCKRIGRKTAEKLKLQWDSTAPTAVNGVSTTSPLLFSELEANPPKLSFPWESSVRCFLPRLHAAEVAVARAAGEKAAMAKVSSSSRVARIKKWIAANQTNNGVELSQGQCSAIEAASDAPMLVITGGPGCGKTTVVQAIVKLWSAQRKLVHICAPTGRAAQRMGVIQGIEPSTIHRLLRYQPRGESGGDGGDKDGSAATTSGGGDGASGADGDGNVDDDESGLKGGFFELGPSNKLKSNAVLVDEASMLSLPLASALMQALESKTQLILVGDVDQLPPIGPGGVLHSLIDSGLVPVVDLREVFRQAAASAIITSALAVREGLVPHLRHATPTADSLLNAGTDALIVRPPDADSVPQFVYDTVVALASADNFQEADLQVITPMKKGFTGSAALNLQLQKLLNPPAAHKEEVQRSALQQHNAAAAGSAEEASERVFRVGDRVLQLVNNYDKDVFNGDQGYIVEADSRERTLVVEFPGQHRSSSATTTTGPAGDDGGGDCDSTKSSESSRKEYHGIELGQLELAYAVTVHKAQGGEAKHVVLALSPVHGRMLTRRLLYTGLTRAKELLVVVAPGGNNGSSYYNGSSSNGNDPLVKAVLHTEAEGRLSSLKLRLEQEREKRGLSLCVPTVFSNEEELKMLAASRERLGKIGGEIESEEVGGLNEVETTGNDDVTLSALCDALGLKEEDVAPALLQHQHGSGGFTTADIVMSHVERLNRVVSDKNGNSLGLEVVQVLRMAPLLLVASSEYFERGLAFAEKLGPLPLLEEHTRGGGGAGTVVGTDESLVDQLRRVLSSTVQ